MEKKSSKDRAKAGKRAASARKVADLTPSKAGGQAVKGGYIFKPLDKMTPK
jgi:hypothetical protein